MTSSNKEAVSWDFWDEMDSTTGGSTFVLKVGVSGLGLKVSKEGQISECVIWAFLLLKIQSSKDSNW